MNPARAPALLLAVLAVCVCARTCASGAEDVFGWRQCAGDTLRVVLTKQPYSDGIKRGLPGFEELTGIQVAFAMHPDATYHTRLAAAFAVPLAQPDVYVMSNVQTQLPGALARMFPLDEFLRTPSLTRQNYNVNDFLPAALAAFRRGATGDLLAIPTGFEGEPPSEQFWGLAINPRSAYRSAAWLFVQYFTSPDFQSSPDLRWEPLRPSRQSVSERQKINATMRK